MEYNFKEIEQNWQKFWKENKSYKVDIDTSRPKYYVLDMFPYPSGAGLHVGHPLGYIASDIYSRYKRLSGFNVLHPMGYDAFGLPAEQYAIQTGQHPAITTETNIARYREQLDKIGFSYDWDREIRTANPEYYKWTQWAFMQMFNHYFNNETQKAESIDNLILKFEKEGTANLKASCSEELSFTSEEWNTKSDDEKQKILLNYRLAFLADTFVNWCPALGTVLANDEVTNGVSVRGGHPVEQKKMRQWNLRVSAYAPRLLNDMQKLEWTDALKEIQKNWIGKSVGAELQFKCLTPALSKGEGDRYGYETANKVTYNLIKENASKNRKEETPAEEALWQEIRNNQLGHKIRRQHIIGNFIVDFVCLKAKLIIEVDGEYHNFQKEEDELRTKELERYGFEVIRFTNDEVLANSSNVAQKIKKALDQKVLSFGEDLGEVYLSVFTTRPDTLYGVTFMVLAPESDYVSQLTTLEQKKEVEAYIKATKKRSERDRMSDVKTISGVFSGSYVIHPITGNEIPVWIADYVLAGYGTGAVMAVPAHDSRDFAFAKHFNLPIIQVIAKNEKEVTDTANWTESYDAKEGIAVNSEMINGLSVSKASKKIISYLHEKGIGKKQVNYRLRDAIFSRQRYWGEPFPVYFKNDLPYLINEKYLPLELPKIDKYLPTEDGKPPLARADKWAWDTVNNKVVENNKIDGKTVFQLEYSTMPGFAGSSAYSLRYMDTKNNEALVSKEANMYWQDVDLYIGGTEHATGHLIYSRFWNKFLFDIGAILKDEPFKKLINQGMIQGRSSFVYRIKGTNKFVSYCKRKEFKTDRLHVDVNIVRNDILDTEAFKNWLPEYKNAEFIFSDDGKYHCGSAVEKMSKSMFNVVNPDDIIEQYGADTLRMYEMFLGPLEQAKPWDTSGIDGVYKFLRKTWNLFYNNDGELNISNEKATKDELKTLHKTIKKVTEDIENFSFNTSVSAFMICVNELTSLKCNKREILQDLLVILSPFAPHVTEELWQNALSEKESILDAKFPKFNAEFLVEDAIKYPVQFNGKTRFIIELPATMSNQDIEKTILEHNNTQKYIDGKTVRKLIVVPKRIINIVVS